MQALSYPRECNDIWQANQEAWARNLEDVLFEEVMDYRTYGCGNAKLSTKPNWNFLLKQGLKRNVKWIYQEGTAISGLCSLRCVNTKSQLGFAQGLALSQP